jgi:hypothetical protein
MIQGILFIMSEKEQAYGFNGYFLRSFTKNVFFVNESTSFLLQ